MNTHHYATKRRNIKISVSTMMYLPYLTYFLNNSLVYKNVMIKVCLH